MIEFKGWPKTTRLESDCTISEKANGSNCAVAFEVTAEITPDNVYLVNVEMSTQTRTQIVTLKNDQVGIAKWAQANKETLIEDLLYSISPVPKPGIYFHYGEFMKRGHKEPHFYLFNTRRWSGVEFKTPTLKVVPVLYQGKYTEGKVEECLEDLRQNGSRIHPGIPAEGVVTFWAGDNTMKKSYTGLVKQ